MNENIIISGEFKNHNWFGIAYIAAAVLFLLTSVLFGILALFTVLLPIIPGIFLAIGLVAFVLFVLAALLIIFRAPICFRAKEQVLHVYEDRMTVKTARRFVKDVMIADIISVEKHAGSSVKFRTMSDETTICALKNRDDILNVIERARNA